MKFSKLKNKLFLNLYNFTKKSNNVVISNTQYNVLLLKPISFKKNFLGLLNVYYVICSTNYLGYKPLEINCMANFNTINYYLKFVRKNSVIFFGQQDHNNIIIFSRPHKQIFFTVFKTKPIFIFTCGLMKFVINEKKKSSKKLYKVALSLLKLSAIIISKERNFNSCVLKLNNVGIFQSKIIKTFLNTTNSHKLKYTLFKNNLNVYSQKLGTRRSIKKYVKKRFVLP